MTNDQCITNNPHGQTRPRADQARTTERLNDFLVPGMSIGAFGLAFEPVAVATGPDRLLALITREPQSPGRVKSSSTPPEEAGSPVAGQGASWLTPDYLAVMTEATDFISAMVTRSIEEDHPAGLKQAVLRRLEKLRLVPKRKAPALLTPDQLTLVRAVALRKARELNLPEAQAERLADAVVGSCDT